MLKKYDARDQAQGVQGFALNKARLAVPRVAAESSPLDVEPVRSEDLLFSNSINHTLPSTWYAFSPTAASLSGSVPFVFIQVY